jgi:hypothetical protein
LAEAFPAEQGLHCLLPVLAVFRQVSHCRRSDCDRRAAGAIIFRLGVSRF